MRPVEEPLVPDTAHTVPAAEREERQLAWTFLSRVGQGPCAPLSALIDSVGVLEAARAVRECELPDALRTITEQRSDPDLAARDLERMNALGGRIITPDDPEWPAWRLLGLGRLDAGVDRDAAVPLVLWVRGSRSLVESSEQALAVVGARCSSGYGEQVTADMAADLAVRGWTIVSGAAFGIDAVAHRAALSAGACTIAVLACGVDRPYPAQHHRLLAQIAESGLVVSEYPPGFAARKHHFLARNRLIAALGRAVLVVEAGARSGARNTVKWSRRLGCPALAVPGSVESASSVGCHLMIRAGEAVLVTTTDQVVAEAGPLTGASTTKAQTSIPVMSGDEALLFEVLSETASQQPYELAEQCGLALGAVRSVLPALELAGLAGVDGSGWYRLRYPVG